MSTLSSEPRRPRLLATNRKLRHLKGLSLRNLCFAPTQLRTADDVAIHRSSAAAAAAAARLGPLRESNEDSFSALSVSQHQKLHASRSFENLRRHGMVEEGEGNGARSPSSSPSPARPRLPQNRRTSLSLGHPNAAVRQKKLESLVEANMGDVFFSLHVNDTAEPVYVSETRERSANFNFRFFELGDRESWVSRSCYVIIRIWAKKSKDTSFSFLLEELIDLRTLKFIGTLLDRRFPPNALVFHLEDGLYSLDFPSRESEPRQAPAIASSSYNALMKLANLETSIEDAIETRWKIMQQINEILESSSTIAPPDAAKEGVVLAGTYVAIQQRANKLAEKRRDELLESLRSRRAAIKKGREVQARAEEDIANNREKLAASRELIGQTEQRIRGQRRRICSDLADIFPITPIPNSPPLSFQICNMPLPNSVYDAAIARSISEDALSAALGHVTLLARHLQFYLSHPAPYPLHHYGSRSYVVDEISHLPDQQTPRREFPLYLPRGGSTSGQWRFEYGWFLLNKDIETLCASQGLKVVDIRHSLPNIKYLLYVCSAGSDEVPVRKKGGVRGLWAGRLKGRLAGMPSLADAGDGDGGGSMAGSRRGSVDSELMSQQGDTLRNVALVKAREDGSDNAVEAAVPNGGGSLWDSDGNLGLPFDQGGTKFTLRTKGLRENVA